MHDTTKRMLPACLCFVAATLTTVACKDNPTSPTETAATSTTTRLSFTGEPSGSFGPARNYTLQNASFRALSLRSGGAVEIDIRPTDPGDRSGPWTFMMGSPFGRGLAPGTYATNPFETDGGYGFLFFGGDSYCDGNGSAGSVTIHEIAINPSTVQRFRASFTIRCERGATVRGDIVALADPWR
jgi:hypothetical protein